MTHQATAKMFAAVGVAAAGAATAWSNTPDRFLVLWGYLLLGPLAGFLVGVMGTYPIGDWAPTVAVTTAVSVSPLIKAFRATDPAWVFLWWFVAAALWYFTGYLYIIGMWA